MSNEIKKLGFGMMRLPRLANPEKDANPYDIEQVKQMVDAFLEAGFTYFDTAWAYDWSEDSLRQALVERHPRESYQLATKCSAWLECKTREDAVAQFRSSLEITQAGYFDYYLLHNLGTPRTEPYDRFDLWNYFAEQKEKGLIKHLGFSFHSTPEELDKILTDHPEMEFVQIQLNYADWDAGNVQARANYEVCRRHGKPVIVMEPVKGGLLATPPQPVADVFKAAKPDASMASWAIKFAADLPGVMVVLSGMSSLDQMKDNVAEMKGFTGLTEEERAVIERARETLAGIPVIPCTTCNYCAKVCPQNIAISGSFNSLNMLTLYGNKEFAARNLGFALRTKAPASECIECGACEDACPQHIAIRDELKRAVEVFGK